MSYPSGEWTPYTDANLPGGGSAAGYARYSNLSTARALWDGTVSSGVQASSLTKPPRHMALTVATQSVRVKFGTDPTASEGQLLTANTYWFDNTPDVIKTMRIIEAAASAEVTVTYFF